MTDNPTTTGPVREVFTTQLVALGVPEGTLRTAVLALLDVVDAPIRPGDMPIALRALGVMYPEIHDLYAPPGTADEKRWAGGTFAGHGDGQCWAGSAPHTIRQTT